MINALLKNNSDKRLGWILFCIAFLAYANTLTHGFVWDDSIVITENPYVHKGFKGIPEVFVKHVSDYRADKYGYRPVTLTSFAIEYGVFRGRAGASHFMNVFYFALLCMVLFKTLRLLFHNYANLAPFLITLLFALHPVHTEAVANIKSRDEVFALLFSLLSLAAFIRFISHGKVQSAVLTILFFTLAFLSKENAVVFLAILPLTYFYLKGFSNLKKIIVPVLIVTLLGALAIAILKLSQAGSTANSASAGAGVFLENGLLGNSFFYCDLLGQKIANAFVLLLLYLNNFFFPVRQLYFYGYNQIPVAGWNQPAIYISVAINLALVVYAITRFHKKDPIAFGILYYFISISVFLHLFRTLADTMADRFLFMPSLGLCIVVVFALGRLLKIDPGTLNVSDLFTKQGRTPYPFRYGILLICILFGAKTIARNRVWKDNTTLVSADMPALENCARAHNYYADDLKRKLYATFDPAKEAEMIRHYRRAIEITKESYYSYLGLSTYYCDTKKLKEGIALLDTMIALFPNAADPYFYIGQALFQTQEYPRAIKNLEKSLELAPEVFSTYYILSVARSKNAQFKQAHELIDKAKEKFGESAQIYEALGNIYFDEGNMPASTQAALEMLRFGADPQKVYGVVIGRYQTLKQDSLAAKYYNEALAKGIFRR